VFGVPAGAAVLVLASWITRRHDAQAQAFVQALRAPAPGDWL
jgi:hypothetical protein